MKLNRQLRRGFTLVELLVVIVIIAALAGLTAPQVIKFKKKGDVAEATNNARQMALGLSEFESEYGSYPDRSTAEQVIEQTGSSLSLQGDTSNDYFRQLIAAGTVKSEFPFYAKSSYSKKPDDIFTGEKALAAGEVGFGYIMNNSDAMGTGTPGRPIAVTPLLNGRASGGFDAEPFEKAIVLFVDSSVKQINIRPSDKKGILGGGNDILETGPDTVWGTEINPVIKAPKGKGGGSGGNTSTKEEGL